jgi:hypothetical protein
LSTLDPAHLPPSKFGEMLSKSLDQWRAGGKGGVWLKVPHTRTEVVHLAIAEGFEIHHAQRE